jgi:hypothetical protein
VALVHYRLQIFLRRGNSPSLRKQCIDMPFGIKHGWKMQLYAEKQQRLRAPKRKTASEMINESQSVPKGLTLRASNIQYDVVIILSCWSAPVSFSCLYETVFFRNRELRHRPQPQLASCYYMKTSHYLSPTMFEALEPSRQNPLVPSSLHLLNRPDFLILLQDIWHRSYRSD